MAGVLNIHQQAFCMSMVIDTAANKTGSVSKLRGLLTGNIRKLLADTNFSNGEKWSLVWGPVVWQAPGSNVVDQAMAICYDSSTCTYFMPIAATNPASVFDVVIEDLGVPAEFMQPFPHSGPGKISGGNAVALGILLAAKSAGLTAAEFLASKVDVAKTVVVSGHSLGGGLAPLLAYALFPVGTSKSGWKNVFTFPTAGPSTADLNFTNAYRAAFPITGSTGYQRWNANQYNGFDIVPNAWSGTSAGPGIGRIAATPTNDDTTMFWTDLDVFADVLGLQVAATALATGSTSANPYVATNYHHLFSGPRRNGQLASLKMLEGEILYQHTVAYANTFGVSHLFPDGLLLELARPSILTLLGSASAAVRAAPAIAAARTADTPRLGKS